MTALISHSKRLFAPLRCLPLRLGLGGLLVGGWLSAVARSLATAMR